MERGIVATVLVCLFLAPISANSGFWSRGASPEQIASAMTNAELAGQVLMLGYSGVTPSTEFLEFIRDTSLGGVKVFGWNTGDLVELARGIGHMQASAAESERGIPLFVATDQEGGWVRHVKGETSDTPGNLAIGASGLPLDAYENGLIIGRELAVLGINMNFAPTVDVYTHPRADVIGPRAFSANPVETGLLGLAFFRGLEAAGVIATAKHFPGHGNTDEDSHGTLPVIDDELETIWNRDLVPYRMLISEGLPAIMSGHLSFPSITQESIAATLSPFFLRSLLRDELAFGGIIITDDMRMYGALQNGIEVKDASVLAIRAGNDMIMVSHDLDLHREIYDHLVQTANEDPQFRRMLIDSVTRVLAIKARYLGGRSRADLLPDAESVRSRLPAPDASQALFDLACRSVAIVRPSSVPLPVSEHSSTLLVGQYEAFFSEGLRRFPDADTFPFAFAGTNSRQMADLQRLVENYDRIVFCLANDTSLEVLHELEHVASKITVFSVQTPVYLREVSWVRSAIAAFARGVDSFRAGFAVLSGDYTAEGTSPIPLDTPIE